MYSVKNDNDICRNAFMLSEAFLRNDSLSCFQSEFLYKLAIRAPKKCNVNCKTFNKLNISFGCYCC